MITAPAPDFQAGSSDMFLFVFGLFIAGRPVCDPVWRTPVRAVGASRHAYGLQPFKGMAAGFPSRR